MKIKICATNSEKIRALLKGINGKANEHTINDPEDIWRYVSQANQQLRNLTLMGRNQQGAKFFVVSGDSVAKSYKYKRKVTCLTLYRGKDDWFITGVSSALLYPDNDGYSKLQITVLQKDKASKGLFKGVLVSG